MSEMLNKQYKTVQDILTELQKHKPETKVMFTADPEVIIEEDLACWTDNFQVYKTTAYFDETDDIWINKEDFYNWRMHHLNLREKISLLKETEKFKGLIFKVKV